MDGIRTVFTLCMINGQTGDFLAQFIELFEERFREIIVLSIGERIPFIAPEALIAQYSKRFILTVTTNQWCLTDYADVWVIITIISACISALLSAFGAIGWRRYRNLLSTNGW